MKEALVLSLLFLLLSSPARALERIGNKDLKQQFNNELVQMRSDELKDCQRKLQAWESWAAVNVPKNAALLAENDKLRDENRSLNDRQPSFLQLVAVGAGVGLGLGFIVLSVLSWKKLARSTPKKQLAIMIVSSSWIVVVGAFLMSDSDLSRHPVNLLAALFVCSLPAILFGAIALWWFKKASPAVIKS